MNTIIQILGWSVVAYGAGGLITALLYIFLVGVAGVWDALVIALAWPFWLYILIAGGLK